MSFKQGFLIALFGGLAALAAPLAHTEEAPESDLMRSLRSGHFDEAVRLVRAGADVTYTTNTGEDAYSLAIEKEQFALAAEIYEHLKGPSISRLIEEAEEADIHSRDAFVEFISKKYGENYVLMRETASVQGATNETPRAILFQPNALLVATFTDHPTDPKKAAIEMMQFDLLQKKFSFQELRFDHHADAPALRERLSKLNPTICASCHQGRPIWDPWPIWRGAVGGTDDYLRKPNVKTSWGDYLRKQGNEEQISADGVLARKFLDSIKDGTSSYIHLKSIAERFNPEKRSDLAAERESDPDPRKAGDALPNQRYTHQLILRNFDRIAGELMSNPNYAALRLSVVAALSGCYDNRENQAANLKADDPAETAHVAQSKIAQVDSSGSATQKALRSKQAILALYALDASTGSNFTKQLAVADSWTMTTRKGSTPFGPFAVARFKEWTLERVVRHLQVHDPELQKLSLKTLACPDLLEKSSLEITAFLANKQ